VKFLFASLLLACLAIDAHAEAAPGSNPTIITMPDPGVAYTLERPASLYYKEVVLTRVSQRKLDVVMTLRGEAKADAADNLGLNYRIYFDFDRFDYEDPILNIEGFKEDQYVNVFRAPNSSAFKSFTREEILYRSRVLKTDVSAIKASGDKISFTITSDLFAIPDNKIRVFVKTMVKKRIPSRGGTRESNDWDTVERCPFVDMPEKGSSRASSQDPFAR
jgi:hypothetical protein